MVLMGPKWTRTAPPTCPSLPKPRKRDPIASKWTQKSTSSIKWQYQMTHVYLKRSILKCTNTRPEYLIRILCQAVVRFRPVRWLKTDRFFDKSPKCSLERILTHRAWLVVSHLSAAAISSQDGARQVCQPSAMTKLPSALQYACWTKPFPFRASSSCLVSTSQSRMASKPIPPEINRFPSGEKAKPHAAFM